MTQSHISSSVTGHVATIIIDRPPHNYFTEGLLAALAREVMELDSRDDCRVMVLASAGKTFCPGADFTTGEKVDAGAVYRAALPMFRRRKPLVVAVQGPAVGGGLGLAVAGDFRIAAPEARFHANFVKIGLHPGFGLTWTLPRLLGHHAAMEMMLSGRRIGGEEAVAIGLADRLAPRDTLLEEAQAFAREIASGAPLAIETIRCAFAEGEAEQAEHAMARELIEQERLFQTADFAEGVAAQAERRPPNFLRR